VVTGQEYDIETGLYFYKARYYNPALGRFVQPDTFVQNIGDPQSYNRYAYVRNNPLKYTDPSGHMTDPKEPSEAPSDDGGEGGSSDGGWGKEQMEMLGGDPIDQAFPDTTGTPDTAENTVGEGSNAGSPDGVDETTNSGDASGVGAVDGDGSSISAAPEVQALSPERLSNDGRESFGRTVGEFVADLSVSTAIEAVDKLLGPKGVVGIVVDTYNLTEKLKNINENEKLSDLDKGLLSIMQVEVTVGGGVASAVAAWGGAAIGGGVGGVVVGGATSTVCANAGDRFVNSWRGRLERDTKW